MTDSLVDAYLRELARRLPLDDERKRQVVAEMRAHLLEKVDELRRERPTLSRDDAMRDALNDFGAPSEVAAGFGAAEPPPSPSAAEPTPLSPGRKRLVVALAIFLALNMVGGAVAAWVAWSNDDDQGGRAYDPQWVAPGDGGAHHRLTVLDYGRRCDEACDGSANRSMLVASGDRYLQLWANAEWFDQPPQGTVRVRVLDPRGDERYAAVFDADHWNRTKNMTAASPADDNRTGPRPVQYEFADLTEDAGRWNVVFEFEGFVGEVGARAQVYRSTSTWVMDVDR